MSSELRSHIVATEQDEDSFPDDWLETQGLKRSVTYRDNVYPATAEFAIDERKYTTKSKCRERVLYHTTGFATVPHTSDAHLPPPASILRSVPETSSFETWLKGLQTTPALEHSSERQLRLARDARLLSALRDCHSDHINHIRRLEDTRALAIHTLNLPIVRHLSMAQGREVRVHPDTVSDHELLSTRDTPARDVSVGYDEEDNVAERSEYPCSSSSDENASHSDMSVTVDGPSLGGIGEAYEDAILGQKRGRVVVNLVDSDMD